jgi:hypothetical protein
VPILYNKSQFCKAGGLICFGARYLDFFRRGDECVSLHGMTIRLLRLTGNWANVMFSPFASETAAYVQVTCRLPGFPVSVTSPCPVDLAVRPAQAMHDMRKVGTVAQ